MTIQKRELKYYFNPPRRGHLLQEANGEISAFAAQFMNVKRTNTRLKTNGGGKEEGAAPTATPLSIGLGTPSPAADAQWMIPGGWSYIPPRFIHVPLYSQPG